MQFDLIVPCVVDRVIQQAILQVLTPIFDPGFSESSFGSRPQRSAHGAIKQIKGYLKAGYRIAVDLDLEKFFDTVQHDVLMTRVSRKVHNKVLLKLIGRYLRAGVMVDGIIQATDWGTPQGSPIAPPTILQKRVLTPWQWSFSNPENHVNLFFPNLNSLDKCSN